MNELTPPVALTIAGCDPSGCAGLAADLRTFAAFGVYGTAVVTALTAQNTLGVRAIEPVPAGFVAEQLAAVLDDLPVRAVKTGMLASAATVELLAGQAARLPNLVVDPVLVSSTGQPLFEGSAVRAYQDRLFPHAAVVTPNLREASVLVGRALSTVDDAVAAAAELGASGARCVVVKGGHLDAGDEAVDVVWCDGSVELLRAPRVATTNDRGTGCTFAAALVAGLARGDELSTALPAAKSYVHNVLRAAAGWRLGGGPGPLSWEVSA